ncbi:MAG: TRAP transporter small permease [Oscillospiraceae bacterium]
MMERFAKRLEFLLKAIVLILLGCLVVLVFMQVVLRYVFSYGIAWSEEMSRYLFVWSVFLSIAVAVKQKSHLMLEYFVNKSAKFKPYFHALYYVAYFLFFSVVFYYGIIYTISGHGAKSALLPLRLSAVYSAVPVCALLSSFFLVVELIGKWKIKRRNGD